MRTTVTECHVFYWGCGLVPLGPLPHNRLTLGPQRGIHGVSQAAELQEHDFPPVY